MRIGAYWSWDELLDPYEGEDRLSWPVKDNGAPAFHSYVLVAREQWADEHPEALRDVLTATEAGFRAAAADRLGATATVEDAAPYLPRRVLERSLELVAPTWFHDERWGVLRPELIEPYAHWLHENGALADLSGLAGAIRSGIADASRGGAGPGGTASTGGATQPHPTEPTPGHLTSRVTSR